MPKQMIEIDVPDGYEFNSEFPGTDENGDFAERIIVILKKKEPKFIEVRDYLITTHDGITIHVSAQKGISDIKAIEEHIDFTRWIDHDWRKVEI